jgi:hypothetical protein
MAKRLAGICNIFLPFAVLLKSSPSLTASTFIVHELSPQALSIRSASCDKMNEIAPLSLDPICRPLLSCFQGEESGLEQIV